MGTVRIDLDDVLVNLLTEESDEPLERAALELIVLELHRRGRLSGGKAAELLGMPRGDFIVFASSHGIPYIDMTEEEWETEMRTVAEMTRRLSSSPIPAR